MTEEKEIGTILVHTGGSNEKNSVTMPIHLSTTFIQDNVEGPPPCVDDEYSFGEGYEYQRISNPTRGAFEKAMADIEKGKYAVAFSSGMAAISSILHLLPPNSHIIAVSDLYGGTYRLFEKFMKPVYGMQVEYLDDWKSTKLTEIIRPETSLIWIETPTNPSLKLIEIKRVVDQVKERSEKILVVVDNTFATPYLQNPLEKEADVVIHSVTKYIAGHSDVVMGCVITNDEAIYDSLRMIQRTFGAVPAPFDCYMAIRGMKTLHLRMEKAQENAYIIAHFLETKTDFVKKCIYPGLKNYTNMDIKKKQMRGDGGMISFILHGENDEAIFFLKQLKLFKIAVSLGAVESLAEIPYFMTHGSMTEEHRERLGLSKNFIRLSVGIEDVQDLLKDLEHAFQMLTQFVKKNDEQDRTLFIEKNDQGQCSVH